MRAVLYSDHDMEPITVIALRPWMNEFFRERRHMKLAVPGQVSFSLPSDKDRLPDLRTIEIWGEMLVRTNRAGYQTTAYMLFTNNDELALLLDADVLPGQRKKFQDEFKLGIVQGIMKAIGYLGDDHGR